MLKSIQVRNFACFNDHEYKMDFTKLNIIVGPNNSGKSAIFKALNFVRFHAVHPFAFPENWNTDYYELHDFHLAIYNHDTSKLMKIVVNYEDGAPIEANFGMRNQNLEDTYLKYGDKNAGDLRQSIHAKAASKIWYLSSFRSIIPFRSQIGSTESDKLQPIRPDCLNITQFLLERYNARDEENWKAFEDWMEKIDPQIKLFKTSLKTIYSSLETNRFDGQNDININLNMQGSGIQSIISIVAAIVFSPKGNTIIIEEPENFLNSKTIEVLVDLFNHATKEWSKQIFVITHSWDILKQYISDIGAGTQRGAQHVKANADEFSLFTITSNVGTDKITKYDLTNKQFNEVVSDFKQLWG